jgi:DNA modification methylase
LGEGAKGFHRRDACATKPLPLPPNPHPQSLSFFSMENQVRIILGDSRAMPELADDSVDLVVTSPPYWHLKDYGVPGQIGYGQSLHEYLKDLYYVWRECFRVLKPGSRLCLNSGDQFARAAVYGRYKVIPLHAEFIAQGESLGFDFMGAIIWQKKTTMNTTGGAVVMGSYPYPPNGIIELDYEFILVFKKPGERRKVSTEIKEASKLTKDEWKEYFHGHWHFGGVRQVGHEAMFPEELPRRLIRMFTFKGDTVLDPFLGSGTTVKVARELGRQAVGYEVQDDFLAIIQEKLRVKNKLPVFTEGLQIIRRPDGYAGQLPPSNYRPAIQDAKPLLPPHELKKDHYFKVVQIIGSDKLKLDNGQVVEFLGVKVENENRTINYLTKRVLGKQVIVKNGGEASQDNVIPAYVYLKNKIFINTYLLKGGLARPDAAIKHQFQGKFLKIWRERELSD